MASILSRVPPKIGQAIRALEIGAVIGLTFVLIATYRDLAALRSAPVVLPTYGFEISPGTETEGFVRVRGTWVADRGPSGPLQTTTIECNKARKQCVESVAVVTVINDRQLLESTQTTYEVERWTEAEVVTTATEGRCSSRTLLLDLAKQRATSHVSAAESRSGCRSAPERWLTLVAGVQVRDAALKKATLF